MWNLFVLVFILSFFLVYEINWVRKIINDGVEALTRKSRAPFHFL